MHKWPQLCQQVDVHCYRFRTASGDTRTVEGGIFDLGKGATMLCEPGRFLKGAFFNLVHNPSPQKRTYSTLEKKKNFFTFLAGVP